MRKWAFLGLLTLAGHLAAFGGTAESWLGGTRSWDTVPYFELNLGAQAQGGQGPASAGPFAEWGIVDQLQASGAWDQPFDGSAGHGEALLTLREEEFPRWRPALALTLRGLFNSGGSEARAGMIAAVEVWDQSLALNVESVHGLPAFRLGYWTPYVVSFLRLGMEACSSEHLDQAWRLLPQATLQFPGDVSIVAGAQTFSQGPSEWSWLLRVSVQLFPSP